MSFKIFTISFRKVLTVAKHVQTAWAMFTNWIPLEHCLYHNPTGRNIFFPSTFRPLSIFPNRVFMNIQHAVVFPALLDAIRKNARGKSLCGFVEQQSISSLCENVEVENRLGICPERDCPPPTSHEVCAEYIGVWVWVMLVCLYMRWGVCLLFSVWVSLSLFVFTSGGWRFAVGKHKYLLVSPSSSRTQRVAQSRDTAWSRAASGVCHCLWTRYKLVNFPLCWLLNHLPKNYPIFLKYCRVFRF